MLYFLTSLRLGIAMLYSINTASHAVSFACFLSLGVWNTDLRVSFELVTMSLEIESPANDS